jgi:hypothetical protein
VLEESAEAQEGAQQPSDQAEEKRSGPLVFHVQEAAEKRTGREDLNRQILSEEPDSRWIC